MHTIEFTNLSNEMVWQYLFDPRYDHILVSRLALFSSQHWQTATLQTDTLQLQNVQLRQLEMDVYTNLASLRKFTELNTSGLIVYQFNRPVPGSLYPERLPEATAGQVLQKNGLQHRFIFTYEFLTVSSFDEIYLQQIRDNETLRPFITTH